MFFLWIRCRHTQALLSLTLYFLGVGTLEFISSALPVPMWQFEGEDLPLDDPNIVDILMGAEDFFTEGMLGCEQHTHKGGNNVAERSFCSGESTAERSRV